MPDPPAPPRPDDVAVVGIGALFPGAPDVSTYWDNIVNGVDAVTAVPPGRWDASFHDPGAWDDGSAAPDRIYCNRGGFVDDLATFDPTAFGIMPVTVDGAEPDQFVALRVAAAALADVGGSESLPAAPDRTGVILGRGGYLSPGVARLDQRVRTAHQLTTVLGDLLPDLAADQLDQIRQAFVEQLGPSRPEASIGLVPNLAASRIANRLDLRGPAYTVDAACASSLVAVDAAVAELRSGRCDAVLAGGVHHCHDITFWSVFTQLRALSPTGCIRPFDRRADGLLIGEGTGIVVLKRWADAQRDGNRVYAVVRGTGVASDGRGTSLMSPRVDGQVLALRRAWDGAGLDPDACDLIEAHGTATPAGDEAELATLARFFGPLGDGDTGDLDDPRRAALGSVKSMIGHTMPAAGIAGLIKAALALHHRVLPPTLHAEEPNPDLVGTRFRLLDRAAGWDTQTGATRVAAVNAFGFGGINAHAVLTSPPEPPARRSPGAATVLPAPTGPATRTPPTTPVAVGPAPAGLMADRVVLLADETAEGLLDQLAEGPAAHAILTDRDDTGRPAPATGPWRLAIVDPSPRRLDLARKVVERGTPWRGRNDVWFTAEPLLAEGALAFVFPGVEPSFDPQVVDLVAWLEATGGAPPGAGRLARAIGRDDLSLGQQGAAIIALARSLQAGLGRLGIRPDLLAGHSIGEWSAMIASELIPPGDVDDFIDSIDPDALEVPGVIFAMVGAGADRAAEVISDLPGVVVSHDNCPHQSIICGDAQGVRIAVERLATGKVLAQELSFRSGFHSPMFEPYLDPVREANERVPMQEPRIPLWSATTVAPYPDDERAVRDLVVRHLVEPVRFRQLVERLHDQGVRGFVQMGVGSVGGFVDDTLRDRPALTVAAASPKRPALDQLRRVGAALWVEGRTVDLRPLAPTGAPQTSGAHLPTTGTRAAGPSRGSDAPGRAGPALRLGTPLVHLEGVAPLTSAGARPGVTPPADLAGHPLYTELSAALDEAAAASAAVLHAWSSRAGRPSRSRRPGPAAPPSPTSPPDTERAVERTLHLSVEERPELVDHCFYRQPDGWPDVADRFPVVPMTTLLQLFADTAAELVPGTVPVAIENVRALRWLAVAPPVEVTLTARIGAGPDTAGAWRVRLEIPGHTRGTVVLAPSYPDPPAPDAAPLTDARPSDITAAEMYEQRYMFHGPRFQGVAELGAVGVDGISGTLDTPDAPGALLDCAGQLMGYWVMRHTTRDRLAFPTSIDRVSLFGPHPAAGERVGCTVRIRSLTDTTAQADLELVGGDGRLWCRIDDWRDQRFDTDPESWPLLIWPERELLARPQPGGWMLAEEHWRNSASRELMMRRFLTSAEREEYAARNPRVQRLWLLGRIAAKDAVRRRLWSRATGSLFPAEIGITNDADGRPVVSSVPTWPVDGDGEGDGETTDLHLSIAHSEWLAVAMVGDGPVGIDVERVEPRGGRTAAMVLTADEHRLLTDEPADLRLTRLWAAKEAAAKADGTGLRGRPKDFVASRTERRTASDAPSAPVVRIDVGRHRIDTTTIERDGATYVVAWTTDPHPRRPHPEEHP